MIAGLPAAGLPLGQAFFLRPVTTVARELVGKVLVARHSGSERSVRIVETEAYGGVDDPASHAGRGPTPRSSIMYGPGGFAYVYLSYGVHHCLNLVTGPEGEAGAVLLRAGEPLAGIDPRPGTPDHRLAAGPGLLCRALAVDLGWNGVPVAADLPEAGRIGVWDDGVRPPVRATARIGIRRAAGRPWRFATAGSRFLSRQVAVGPSGPVDKCTSSD